MFGWEFPPNITGGLGTACYGLTKGLLNAGVKVHFLLPRKFGNEDPAVDIINASSFSLPDIEELSRSYRGQFAAEAVDSPLSPYATAGAYLEEMDTLKKSYPLLSEEYQFSGKYGETLFEEVHRYAHIASGVARVGGFDLIHVHDWPVYPAGIMAKDVSGKPLIVHVHATEFDRSGERVNQMVCDIERLGMQKADKIIAVSHYTKGIIVERYGIPPEKVAVVHNAVDREQFIKLPVSSSEKIVVFLGRVTFQKGPDYFVEAAAKVLEKRGDVRFVMAGSGDMFRRLIHRATDLGISSHFHFTGFLNKEDVNRLLNLASVYVMPSVSEPFGLSALEAMKAEVPVIISKQSGVAEVLRNVIKVDFWDVEALANAIYGILQYDALAQNMRDSGTVEVSTFDWNLTARKIQNIYQSVL